jgi:NitT/TauT family transport system substrate-binding protein
MFYLARSNMTDILVARPDVKTAADLKGKPIAISSYGSLSHGDALVALNVLGLTDKDVTLTLVGNDTARLAALKAGGVAAAIQDGDIGPELTKQGYNVLVDLEKDSKVGIAREGLAATAEFVDKYPNTALALTAAEVEALNRMYTDKEPVIASLTRGGGVPRDKAVAQVDDLLSELWFPRDGYAPKEAWELSKGLLTPTNPAVANVDVTKAYTTKFVDQLKALGFFKQIGVPGY